MQKPGWQTTEFWVTLLVILADVLGAISKSIELPYAGVATAVAGGLYAISRGLAKVTIPPPTV